MKLKNILKELENTAPESFERTGHRRDLLKNLGTKLALASVPVFASSVFNKAQAKTTDVLAETIFFALTGTNMMIAFYEKGLATPNLIAAGDIDAFNQILAHNKANRDYWYNVLTSTGNTLPTAVNYDFTAKGAFPKTFIEYGSFLTLAHTLADVTVRIYAQAIQDMVINKALRGDAVNMRCTLARHAAHIRLLTRNTGIDIMPWITKADANTIVGELIAGYQGEELTKQQQYEVININGAAVSVDAATQAFDEPMPVLVAQAFIAKYTK